MKRERVQEVTKQDIIDQKTRLIESNGLREDFIDNMIEEKGLEDTYWWLLEHSFWTVVEGLKNYHLMMDDKE